MADTDITNQTRFQFDLPIKKKTLILILLSDFTEYLGLRISNASNKSVLRTARV